MLNTYTYTIYQSYTALEQTTVEIEALSEEQAQEKLKEHINNDTFDWEYLGGYDYVITDTELIDVRHNTTTLSEL